MMTDPSDHISDELPADLIPLTEACRLLPGARAGKSMSISALWRWTENGRLRYWRVGRLRFVRRADVLAQLRRGRALPPRLPPEPVTNREHERAVAELEVKWGLTCG